MTPRTAFEESMTIHPFATAVVLRYRSETQSLLTGLNEGEFVAHANPTAHDQQGKAGTAPTAPGKALPK